jgi:hypothetical protein
MKDIKIHPSQSFYQWEGEPVSTTLNFVSAFITKDDSTKFFIIFTENEIAEIMRFLRTQGYGGHINFHEWLKIYKKKDFDEHIHDTDKEKIVIK